jgi:mannan endo-1,4-beta-mannosidase
MKHQRSNQRSRGWIVAIVVAFVAVSASAGSVALYLHGKSSDPAGPLPVHLPTTPHSYVGVYAPLVPASYAGVTAFTKTTGVTPDITMFYSGWYESFPKGFATTAAQHRAVPLVEIDPAGISVAKIASGHYDGYLSSYAEAVRSYHHPVILSFGHEMNGTWYSWGYRHTPPATFVAAWRHIVTVFRALGAHNVTWLWTVNIINDTQHGKIPSPAAWWPGRSYVTWVGIDGYYLKRSWKFAPLFGPTIAAVRGLTNDPMLIGETGATPASGQPAKISDLFAGIRSYGLLGFVWFDITANNQEFRINTPAAIAAFHQGATTFRKPAS